MATTADSRATLDMLPDELIVAVVEHLALPSLLNLNLVNRRLHRVTLENVYAMFDGPNMACFLRTITLPPPNGRPDLAERVKNVTWELNPHPEESLQSFNSPPINISASERWAITRAYQQFVLVPVEAQVPLDSRFARHVGGTLEVDHWALEFFLMFVPNVEELKVQGVWLWDDHTYWFTNVAANPTRFNRLKSIELLGPMRMENIIPLLEMPSLKHLILDEVIVMRQNPEETFQWEQSDRRVLEEASSGLEKLTMRKSHIPVTALVPILNALKGLKEFKYEHVFHHMSHPMEEIPIDYIVLATVLSRHIATLKNFSFFVHDPWEQDYYLSLDDVMKYGTGTSTN
jgi:hypothetical protein